MSEGKCPCASLERLEGASVPAYVSAYLEPWERETAAGRNQFRCRVCGQPWEKRAPEVKSEGTRPSLVKRN